MFYLVTGKETSKFLVNELGLVISHHEIWYPEVGEDIPPDEVPSLHCHDGG